MPLDDGQFQWDLFISYASEDRNHLVTHLVDTLSQFGLRIWWDQLELRAGDSLSRTIDNGLAHSQFGLIVISRSFLEKRWTEYELRGLTARELAGSKVVLPVWYGVTASDILEYSPPLADKMAVVIPSPSTPDHILEACIKILEVVNPELLTRIHRRTAYEFARLRATKSKMSPSEIRPAPHRHEALPDSLIGRIRLIRAALLAAYPLTMEQWIDGFKRDAHPTKEVEIWEHIAAAYLEVIQYKSLTTEESGAVFAYFLVAASGGEEPPRLPETLEEHRDVIAHTIESKFPMVEILPSQEDEFSDPVSKDAKDVHIEDFNDRISPEVARRLVDRLSDLEKAHVPLDPDLNTDR